MIEQNGVGVFSACCERKTHASERWRGGIGESTWKTGRLEDWGDRERMRVGALHHGRTLGWHSVPASLSSGAAEGAAGRSAGGRGIHQCGGLAGFVVGGGQRSEEAFQRSEIVRGGGGG